MAAYFRRLLLAVDQWCCRRERAAGQRGGGADGVRAARGSACAGGRGPRGRHWLPLRRRRCAKHPKKHPLKNPEHPAGAYVSPAQSPCWAQAAPPPASSPISWARLSLSINRGMLVHSSICISRDKVAPWFKSWHGARVHCMSLPPAACAHSVRWRGPLPHKQWQGYPAEAPACGIDLRLTGEPLTPILIYIPSCSRLAWAFGP